MREAGKLQRRRSAHLSLSLCKVKARVEITEFGSLKTSRTHTHTHTHFLWAAGVGVRVTLSKARIQTTEHVVRAAAHRNAGMAWHITPCSHRSEKHLRRMYADKLQLSCLGFIT